MALAFSQFGSGDRELYKVYLATFFQDVAGVDFVAARAGVRGGVVGYDGGTFDACGRVWERSVGYASALLRGGARGCDGAARGGGVGGSRRGGFAGGRVVGARGSGFVARVVGSEGELSSGEPRAGAASAGTGCTDGTSRVIEVSSKTLANRAKRHKRAEVRRARKSAKKDGKDVVSVASSSGAESEASSGSDSKVEQEAATPSGIPEWRRQNVRAKYHRGAFADCSEDVQRELRESRAKMLVEKNKAAVVEAEHKRRTMEARLKTRVVEAEAEKKRLTLAAENRKLVEARLAALPRGYAETVVSMGLESVADVPSLSSGSVSPDSSISVAELDRMKAAMEKLITRVAELEVQAEDHANEKEAAKKQKQQRPVVRGMFEPTDYERERALYSRWD